MNTHKNIAVTVALAVVLLAIGGSLYKPSGSAGLSRDATTLLPSFSFPTLNVPTLENTPVGTMAWNTWKQYLEAAKDHDLNKIKSLSHQLSPACQDTAREAECFGLMDSVYAFGSAFKAEDFTKIFSDDRQIIMMTKYAETGEEGGQPVQTVLFFTRTPDGTPKVLSLRFCFQDQATAEGGDCVETDPDKRDLDNNGWWDSVEALFNK